MTEKNPMNMIQSELQEGMSLKKCRKCGCMKETLENLIFSLPSLKARDSADLLENIKQWLKKMEAIRYTCLGCEHCYPAVAMNIFAQAFPQVAQSLPLSCDFEVKEQIWPPVPGEYFAFCDGSDCPVAVSTLASVELAEKLANARPKELCIVGKTETENIGVDKIIKNTITNPAIRFLLLTGKDPEGHHSAQTIFALWKNGIDENMRVIGSRGKRPILRNVSRQEVEAFRKQVQVVDLIGCEDEKKIIEKIKELSHSTCECKKCAEPISDAVQILSTPKIIAVEPKKFKLDKAGYFVIIPDLKRKVIVVEHYAYDNKLLHIIEGKDAPSIYSTIIENRWISELSHAAYLGKELAKAELSLKHGFKYIQDKAAGKKEDNTK